MADAVKAPGVFDIGPPVHGAKQVVVIVVVGGHYLSPPRYWAGGLADVGEVVPGDDLDIGDTAVGDQAGPGVQTCRPSQAISLSERRSHFLPIKSRPSSAPS